MKLNLSVCVEGEGFVWKVQERRDVGDAFVLFIAEWVHRIRLRTEKKRKKEKKSTEQKLVAAISLSIHYIFPHHS